MVNIRNVFLEVTRRNHALRSDPRQGASFNTNGPTLRLKILPQISLRRFFCHNQKFKLILCTAGLYSYYHFFQALTFPSASLATCLRRTSS